MNAQLVQVNNQPVQVGWGEEQKALVKATVAKDATDAELDWFFQVCNARNLNPFLKQVWFIKRGGVPTIQTSIDGLRAIANRTGKLQGIKRGIKRVDGKLYAWAEVWRKDWQYTAYEEVSLDEYRGATPIWGKMPETMLKKCAESAALRMAFPEDLSGMYSDEEMEQADRVDTVIGIETEPYDRYLRHVGASHINTPEQQESYKQDKKDTRDRIVAKRDEMGISREQLEVLMDKELTLRLSLTELQDAEKWLEDLDTRMTMGSLNAEEYIILNPPEEIEADVVEPENPPYEYELSEG